MSSRRFHNIVFAIAVCVFLVTAINSVGYHHYDEHFQILEFACIKMDMGKGSDLAWEYPAQIRPTLQPVLVVVVVKFLKAIGIQSAFTWALVLRLLTMFTVLGVIYYAVSSFQRLLQGNSKKAFIILSYFLYFMPYVAVRYSSETLSGACFLLAFTFIHKRAGKNAIGYGICMAAGLLMGLAFEFRFQSALLAFGLLLWLVFIYKLAWPKVLTMLLAIGVAVCAGTLLDSWFYDGFTFTPWNYFKVNILEDRASFYGVEPWYYYATELSVPGANSFVKVLVMVAALIFLLMNRRDIVTLTILPFVLVHLGIAHKEMRFMIPIAFFVPYILVSTWQLLMHRLNNSVAIQAVQLVLVQATFVNVLALLVFMIKPADGQPLVYAYLVDKYANTPLTIYSVEEHGSFYTEQVDLPMNFYALPAYKNRYADKHRLFALIDSGATSNVVVVANRRTDVRNLPIKPVYETTPEWLRKLDVNGWMKIKNADRIIYELSKERSKAIRRAWHPPMALPVGPLSI